MPQLYSNDKWPIIDGHLEVQDSDSNLVGRLFVQAKTLPLDHSCRLSIPISFFSSCEIDPTLLFGVDNQNKKVYWRYFDSQTIKKIDFKNNKDSTTITFDSNKFFDENTSDYIGEWEKIIKNNQFRLQNFDALSNAYNIILQSSNAALGKVNNDFVKVQIRH
jgi:CMP-N-acetylneuraminic acid synthetase